MEKVTAKRAESDARRVSAFFLEHFIDALIFVDQCGEILPEPLPTSWCVVE